MSALAFLAATMMAASAAGFPGRPSEDAWSDRPRLASHGWPKLVLDTDPAICSGYLAAMRVSFSGDELAPNVRDGLTAWTDAVSLFDVDDNAEPIVERARLFHIGRRWFAFLDIDADKDGARESIAVEWHEQSWRGFNFESRLLGPYDAGKVRNLSDPAEEDIRELFERGTVIADTLWSPPTLIETKDGRVFLNKRAHETALPDPGLYQVRAGGLEKICSVETYAPGPTFRYDEARVTNPDSSYTSVPSHELSSATAAFFKKLRQTQGEECYGGTLNPLSRLQVRNALDRKNFLFRPWALKTPRSTIWNISRLLQTWSQIDPWSHRVYRDLVDIYPAARSETVDRLVRDFGMTHEDAEDAADGQLWEVVGAHYSANPRWAFERGGADLVTRLYDGSVLRKELKSLLADVDMSDPRYLFAALDQPTLLKEMISLGAPVNAANSYGKTALMYAAHTNNFNAVKTLLRAGADPERATLPRSGGYAEPSFLCAHQGERTRTALAFAAENASEKVIRLLLKAGADRNVRFGQASLADLLALNPHLNATQRARLSKDVSSAD